MINNDKLLINFDIMKTLPEKKLKAVNILEALSESYFIGINDINDIDEEMIEILENIISLGMMDKYTKITTECECNKGSGKNESI